MNIGEYTDQYVEEVYKIIKRSAAGMDAVYEDWIVSIVGVHGLNALIANKFLETCGIVKGRQLYVLCCEGES